MVGVDLARLHTNEHLKIRSTNLAMHNRQKSTEVCGKLVYSSLQNHQHAEYIFT